jgi:hypothetical protein
MKNKIETAVLSQNNSKYEIRSVFKATIPHIVVLAFLK